MGSGMDRTVYALITLPSGDVVAGGSFSSAGGVAANRIARWNAATGLWTSLSTGLNSTVWSLTTLPSGDLVAGGQFTTAGGVAANNIARWNATAGQWFPFGTGVDNRVFAVTTLPNGDLVAGGEFTTAGGIAANRVARWNAATGQWAPLGTGISGSLPSVYALTTLRNGDLVAGGSFTSAGGVGANFIARWNLATEQWAPMGTGMGGGSPRTVWALTTLPNNDLVAGGEFTTAGGVVAPYIARWGCIATCDDIDFNNNTVFPEDADVIDFFNVLAGGDCSPGNTCNDIDFNNNTVFPEDADVIDFFNVLAGGECP
jgi:hypothetical protein